MYLVNIFKLSTTFGLSLPKLLQVNSYIYCKILASLVRIFQKPGMCKTVKNKCPDILRIRERSSRFGRYFEGYR